MIMDNFETIFDEIMLIRDNEIIVTKIWRKNEKKKRKNPKNDNSKIDQ